MKRSDFFYKLPEDRIAQSPARPRDHSRLLQLNRKSGRLTHRRFFDLPTLLQPGDVLVLNDTKVFPARLIGYKASGGKLEVFLLRAAQPGVWECLIGGKVRRRGQEILFRRSQRERVSLRATVVKQLDGGRWEVRFNRSGRSFAIALQRLGSVPTPPYIRRRSNLTEYQTVYATKSGSVAAPTAGLHFTKGLFAALRRRGVQIERVTLHVGYGTFAPVKVTDVRKHRLHPEWIEVDPATHQRLLQAHKEGRRIIAVGTTSVRTLESLPRRSLGAKKWVRTFILPGYRFHFVDGMITNFHLPESTLLMLVSAFAGRTRVLRAYQEAVRRKYRFYSFGDAMLIE